MKALVVGGGGREHALAWKLAQEASEVLCAPGNAGIAEDLECVPVPASDTAGLLELCRHRGIDLAVIGPEDPLVGGLADALRAGGIRTFGPGAEAAQLEGSKAFSKACMARAGVPTAAFRTFSDPLEAEEYVRSRFAVGRQVAVKASGNALGKGVVVAEDEEAALTAVREMLVDQVFGSAGATVVIEDRLVGREFSLLTLVSERGIASLPIAQDHKRIFDEDQGPNTGGMGTFSPVHWVRPEWVHEVEERMVRPVIRDLAEHGMPFRGTLFTGVMVQEDEPFCLEYNVRFGDPETQSVMMRLGKGFLDALAACADGEAPESPEVLDHAALTVVLASPGYPGSYPKGLPMLIGKMPQGVKLFHAGTRRDEEGWKTHGGRVVGVSATGADLEEARAKAYEACAEVQFEGMQYRRDIGAYR